KAALSERFELQTTVRIHPEANTTLNGLYQSSGNFCSQCEAQGFRNITYYLDRPDVMTTYTTKIIADKEKYPVLLSNGNLIEQGDLEDGEHFAVWNDPYKKPSYLFALVAGNLEHVEDHYQTASGRDVVLRIYTEAHNIDRCDHAMGSLKRAMQWDEQRFGLEYDLDIYMIVAVDDFNMGAMENKGLNVFNSSLVFASPETATDGKYISIEAVIGHEYFHNWTGNRVTCRDWFQLSLKEGLTVFRDQEFTSDLHSRPVKRIDDVRTLRSYQFAEDASPMAHPIRPASYMEINNFYTVTVYEKGAEVVRLYQTLLGKEGFRKGIDLYFERHDGQAVTTEDFLAAMADANDVDLSQMQNWYTQAGTPVVSVNMDYDEAKQHCTLTLEQSCPATPEAEDKKPYLIPMELGLLDTDGNDIPLQLDSEDAPQGTSRVIKLTETSTTVTFTGIKEKPVPSLLRGFSAPVKLEYDYSERDYTFLMANDSDAFNCWQVAQDLAMQTLLGLVESQQKSEALGLSHDFVHAYQKVLNNTQLDHALRAEALSLPSSSDVAERIGKEVNPEVVFNAGQFMRKTLANALRLDLEQHYEALKDDKAYSADPESMGKRSLKNVCLGYLSLIEDESITALCYEQFKSSNNMTDEMTAFSLLVDRECTESEQAVSEFYEKWKDNTQLVDSWFAVQAQSKSKQALERVKALMEHEAFTLTNPNKVRALVAGFSSNYPNFHAENGEGYRFIADRVIELDKKNPQVASRIVRSLMKWRQLEETRSTLMKVELERILKEDNLSGDVFEIVSKALG
ncbi:MAG TPA: aminopeptidase N, partial [Thiothrix sp.]|nr:aminopeptidase N [Thiothrix sp.]